LAKKKAKYLKDIADTDRGSPQAISDIQNMEGTHVNIHRIFTYTCVYIYIYICICMYVYARHFITSRSNMLFV
jgi:hypothetical protein